MSPNLTRVLSREAIPSHRRRYRTASGSDRPRPVAITQHRRLRPQTSFHSPNLKLVSSLFSNLEGFNMKKPKAKLLVTGVVMLAIALAIFAQDGARMPAGETFVLKEGTEVSLKFAQDVSSKTAAEDDRVNFELAEDLKVGDVI